jgi:tripartite-type tricarboxylate transporter receptor subunit TctC
MRKFGAGLSEILGVTVVVENRAGANGNIGANYVAKAKPDGYTLLAGFPGLTSNPSIYSNMTYDPIKDLRADRLCKSKARCRSLWHSGDRFVWSPCG